MADHTHAFRRPRPPRGRGVSASTAALLVALLAPIAAAQEGSRPDQIGPPDHAARPDHAGPDHFGRMFHLPPFAPPTPAITAALEALGRRGGPMDAADQLSAGPVALIVDPALNLDNPNNDTHTAGVTFVGQFLDHDMTFDTTSRLGKPTNPRRSPNSRRPYFDLDSVYGDGPTGSPQLYDAGRSRQVPRRERRPPRGPAA